MYKLYKHIHNRNIQELREHLVEPPPTQTTTTETPKMNRDAAMEAQKASPETKGANWLCLGCGCSFLASLSISPWQFTAEESTRSEIPTATAPEEWAVGRVEVPGACAKKEVGYWATKLLPPPRPELCAHSERLADGRSYRPPTCLGLAIRIPLQSFGIHCYAYPERNADTIRPALRSVRNLSSPSPTWASSSIMCLCADPPKLKTNPAALHKIRSNLRSASYELSAVNRFPVNCEANGSHLGGFSVCSTRHPRAGEAKTLGDSFRARSALGFFGTHVSTRHRCRSS